MPQNILTAKLFAAETQLTAPGNTQWLDVSQYRAITCQYRIANINTSVDVRVEGSLDGTNGFNMNTANTTRTTNGTFAFILASVAIYRVRFVFDSEVGGTNATIDVIFAAN